MAGVVGWDHQSRSGAFDEGPAVVGFEVVIVVTEGIGFVEAGVVGVDPVFAVVVFEALGAGAAEPLTRG